MPLDRYFLKEPLREGCEVELRGKEAHHLVRVMRTEIGATCELINGSHQLAQARLIAIEKERCRLKLLSVETEAAPLHAPILCQALPKWERLDTIVEKGTELGMGKLLLFPGERSAFKELSPARRERIESLLIAAIKQCGRLDLPVLKLMPPLRQWDEIPSPAFFGDLRPGAPPLEGLSQTGYFFNGPESGLSPEEIAFLEAKGAKGVTLHSNTLRTDTAALTVLVKWS